GLLSVQVIPGRTPRDNPQVVVQTLYGAVLLLDGENGDIIWRTTVGQPYWPGHPAAHNTTSILVTRREVLCNLDRASGLRRVATVDRDTRVPDFGMQMLGAPSAAPVADDLAVFVPMDTRVVAYELPFYAKADLAKDEQLDPLVKARLFELLQPKYLW